MEPKLEIKDFGTLHLLS